VAKQTATAWRDLPASAQCATDMPTIMATAWRDEFIPARGHFSRLAIKTTVVTQMVRLMHVADSLGFSKEWLHREAEAIYLEDITKK